MNDNFYNDNDLMVSEEQFAAWLDGTLSLEEENSFMDMAARSPGIQELMDANDQTEETYEDLMADGYEMPAELQDDFELPYVGDNDDVEPYDDIDPYEGDDISDEKTDTDDYSIATADESNGGDDAQDDAFFI